LADLLAFARQNDLDVAMARSVRGVEPLVSVWSSSMLEHVRSARSRGQQGVLAFATSNGLFRAGTFDVDVDAVTNVNTPDDLDSARARVARRTTREIA